MTAPADIAAAPEPLAYAIARNDGPTLTDLRPALVWLLWVAIFSGFCVGSCFFLMAERDVGGIVHLATYATILLLAVRGSVELGKVGFSRPTLLSLDGVAGIGLLMIGLVPFGLWLLPRNQYDSRVGALLLASAFGLLALTSARHREFYRKLSHPVRTAGYAKTATSLQTLGWVKTVYETIWLVCCTVPLTVIGIDYRPFGSGGELIIYVAAAAFFGCLGYAVIWVSMITLHARVLRLSSIREPVGLEVVMAEPAAV